jgi:hypothetical protein
VFNRHGVRIRASILPDSHYRTLAYYSTTSFARRSVADDCPIRKSKVASIDLGEIGL